MKTVLNIKTDVDVKERAKNLAQHLGIPLSTVVNSYLKEFVSSGTFSIACEPSLRPNIRKELEKQIRETRNKKNVSQSFTNVKDAVAWLNR